jgi:predicted nicotinamide N-methyase
MLDRLGADSDLDRFPYGMVLWPSAVALSEWLLDNRGLVRGLKLLELGVGAGLPGIVAAYAGAVVCQTDYTPDSLALAARNAVLNGIHGIERRLLDWRSPGRLEAFDCVIGSDILYERELHASLFSLLRLAVSRNGFAVLADPLRPHGFDFTGRAEDSGWNVTLDCRNVEWEGRITEVAVYVLSNQKVMAPW